MSIRSETQLIPLLKRFSKTCIRRLELAAIHFYFYELDTSHTGRVSKRNTLRHIHGIPRQPPTQIKDDLKLLKSLENDQATYHLITTTNKEITYCFKIDDMGYMILRRKGKMLPPLVLELMEPIVERIADSARASIEHEMLTHTLEAKNLAEDTIHYQLTHDELTHLPNRYRLLEVLQQQLSYCTKQGCHSALILLDLKLLKSINHAFGHDIGNKLLKKIADILRSHIPQEDTVARLEGDIFAIMLTGLGNDTEMAIIKAVNVVNHLSALISNKHVLDDISIHVSASFGVEIFPREQDSAKQIINHADIALSQAKTHDHNIIVIYEKSMTNELNKHLDIERELRHAIVRNELQLYFQPQYHLKTGLIGAEALLRWNHHSRGMIPPGEFIPLAEKSGIIIEIGDWIISKACEHILELEKQGLPNTFGKISINISSRQLAEHDFVFRTFNALRTSGIKPRHLGLEITESTLIENMADTVSKMKQLIDAGVTFSVDDFGVGYSSLSYLTQLPIETLKLDRAFVRDVNNHDSNRAIIQALMTLAKNLRFLVIAEGVENENELECLKSLGCQRYQGFYFSKPIPFPEFSNQLFVERRERVATGLAKLAKR
jgi:diguanylate cyclase (GGDEF)-like protein